MRIAHSPYTLRPRAGGPPREGVLLRVDFGDGRLGYADCHPWPEFGDLPWPDQIASLREGRKTPLLTRSLALARADAEARSEGKSLFEGRRIPRSHLSIPWGEAELERAKEEGYDLVKIKPGGRSPEAFKALAPRFRDLGLRLRLDFNERLSFEEVIDFLERLGGDLSWIDWIEDPCPYDPRRWNELRKRCQVALDFARPTEPSYDVVVVKPAVQDLAGVVERSSKVAVTSYLDHPVGQLGAAWVAATAPIPLLTCGLATHPVYEENRFSRRLRVENARLVPPEGTGIGFDEELAALSWAEIR